MDAKYAVIMVLGLGVAGLIGAITTSYFSYQCRQSYASSTRSVADIQAICR